MVGVRTWRTQCDYSLEFAKNDFNLQHTFSVLDLKRIIHMMHGNVLFSKTCTKVTLNKITVYS